MEAVGEGTVEADLASPKRAVGWVEETTGVRARHRTVDMGALYGSVLVD